MADLADHFQRLANAGLLLHPKDFLSPAQLALPYHFAAARLTEGWDAFQDVLTPAESSLTSRSVAKRRYEQIAGRVLARLLMTRCGLVPSAVPRGEDRAPVWPDGYTGSITHTDGLCLVGFGRSTRGETLGIDIEVGTPIEAALWTRIARPEERENLGQDRTGGAAILDLFVAKEAFYKGQYPQTKRVLWHQDVSVEWVSGDGFAVRFRHTDGVDAFCEASGTGLINRASGTVSAVWQATT